MRMLYSILLLFALLQPVFGQIWPDQQTAVSDSDPIYPVLSARFVELKKPYDGSGYAVATFSHWNRIDSPVLTKLFPKLRFASIQWSESVNPKVKPLPAHDLGLGMELTVAVDSESMQIVKELSDTGNNPQFGQLLADAKIRILTPNDAQSVWEAFCALTYHHLEHEPIVKISDTVWHLGNSSDATLHYFYEIILSQDHVVQSGELKRSPLK